MGNAQGTEGLTVVIKAPAGVPRIGTRVVLKDHELAELVAALRRRADRMHTTHGPLPAAAMWELADDVEAGRVIETGEEAA